MSKTIAAFFVCFHEKKLVWRQVIFFLSISLYNTANSVNNYVVFIQMITSDFHNTKKIQFSRRGYIF